MKRRNLLFVIITLLTGTVLFTSCQKSDLPGQDELTLKAAPVKPTPTLTISYNPAPAVVGQDVNVTANVKYNNVDLTCGQVQLFYATDGLGNPVASNYAGVVWVNATGQPWAAPGGSVTWNYASPGLYGWKAQYQSSGQSCEYENLTGNDAVVLDVQVVADECSEPLTITPFLVSAESADGKTFTFTTQWLVKACEDFTNLKVQGGLTAGSTVVSTDPIASNIKSTKQNTIISWVVPEVTAPYENTFTAVFTKTLKNACTDYDITGAWSAKAWSEGLVDDGLGNMVPGLVETIAGYNNKIYFTTPCP